MSSYYTETIIYHDTRWGAHGRGIWLFPIGIPATIAQCILLWPAIQTTGFNVHSVALFAYSGAFLFSAVLVVIAFVVLFQALHTARKIVALGNNQFVMSRFIGKPLILRSLDIREFQHAPNTIMTRHSPIHSQMSLNIKVILSDESYFYVAEEFFRGGFCIGNLNLNAAKR